jgi:hypothetical protein
MIRQAAAGRRRFDPSSSPFFPANLRGWEAARIDTLTTLVQTIE